MIIYYSLAAVHVLNDIFAHHQEHLTCITSSGITHICRYRPAGRQRHTCVIPEAVIQLNAPDDERKYCETSRAAKEK